MEILDNYENALLATLGSVHATKLVSSKESNKTVRDCSKVLDGMSVELRRELVLTDKTLTISQDG